MHFKDWKPFFYPKSIAIIGASTKQFKFGNLFLQALLDFGYPGKIYPINPRRVKIYGLNSWMLEDITDQIDLVYITVPVKQVPEELRKCANKNYKNIIILTAGFKETGDEGRKIEEECAEIAEKYGLHVIGPNCFGIYHPKGGITLLPGGEFPKDSGDIAMLSQSGGHSVNFVLLGQSDDLRFSKVISYGNALDLDLPDYLEYLNEDPDTKLVVAYTEGIRNTSKLKRVLREFKKPLILWKSGLTEDGARAATSHTGFLGGQAEVWKGFFQQYEGKILRANNFEEMLDTTKAMTYLPHLDKNINYKQHIGVIGGGGGIGIEISDVANQYGLKIPPLSDATRKSIKELVPPEGTSINNPLDIGNPMYMGDQKKLLDVFLEDPNISVLMYDFIVDYVLDLRMMVRILRNYKEKKDIPIIIILREMQNTSNNLALEEKYRKFRDKFHEIKIPTYPSFYRGIRALANYLNYYRNFK